MLKIVILSCHVSYLVVVRRVKNYFKKFVAEELFGFADQLAKAKFLTNLIYVAVNSWAWKDIALVN